MTTTLHLAYQSSNQGRHFTHNPVNELQRLSMDLYLNACVCIQWHLCLSSGGSSTVKGANESLVCFRLLLLMSQAAHSHRTPLTSIKGPLHLTGEKRRSICHLVRPNLTLSTLIRPHRPEWSYTREMFAHRCHFHMPPMTDIYGKLLCMLKDGSRNNYYTYFRNLSAATSYVGNVCVPCC